MPPDSLAGQFLSTRWSLIEALRGGPPAQATPALEELCRSYWPPLYVFLRRNGHSPYDAEDLVQGFFHSLLSHSSLERATPERGKLRSFLLASLEHFVSDARRRELAAKRGGHQLPLDLAEAERLFAAIPDQSLAPDAAYDREWALSLLDAAIEELGREHASKRSDIPFAILRPFLTSRAGVPRPYEELSAACSVPVGTLKNLVHRLRERLPDALMQQVRATMDNPAMEEVRAELRILADYL